MVLNAHKYLTKLLINLKIIFAYDKLDTCVLEKIPGQKIKLYDYVTARLDLHHLVDKFNNSHDDNVDLAITNAIFTQHLSSTEIKQSIMEGSTIQGIFFWFFFCTILYLSINFDFTKLEFTFMCKFIDK